MQVSNAKNATSVTRPISHSRALFTRYVPGMHRRRFDRISRVCSGTFVRDSQARTRVWRRASSRIWLGVSVLILALVACSEPGVEPAPDAPVPPPGPLACEQGSDFASVDFAGMWHFEVVFEDSFGAGFITLRVDGQSGAYSALASGREPTTLRLDQSGIHIEVVNDETEDGGSLRVRTYHLCELRPDGTAVGTYEFCRDEDCFPATLSGRKLLPLAEPVAEGVTLISEFSGPDGQWRESSVTVNVRVLAGMAYLARRFDGLRVVDLSDVENPIERSHLPVAIPDAEHYNDLKVVTGPGDSTYALMASNARGVVVIDVSDPDAPTEVTSFPAPELAPDGVPAVHTLFVDGTRAYVSLNYDESLRVYDISDPRTPVALGQFRNERLNTEPGTLHDLYVGGNTAYLNYWGLGMSLVDVSDPSQPVLLGEYRDYGERSSHSNWVTQVGDRTISVHGDEQYNAHVRIVDVDPQSSEFLATLGSYQTRSEVSVHNILASGQRAYVAYYQDGLRILDLSDPHNPQKVAHYHTWPGIQDDYGYSFFEGAIGLDYDPATRTIYLADTHRGLLILSED